ncbi:UNVERIFIED_CONTAM: hypothetical protein Sradi_6971200 [Sesamum radiatum]|uniref:Reverse transcriptase zinc-binding domain-containing protein n=1 Tax=Sesamum radiatum TaxID=300843 RepID=A0AAW2JDX9_SESRA
MSGLHVNPNKSTIILSKAVRSERRAILDLMGFPEAVLPIKYLGVPLIASRLTVADCQPLIDRFNNRLAGWGHLLLSFADPVDKLCYYCAVVLAEIDQVVPTFSERSPHNGAAGRCNAAGSNSARPMELAGSDGIRYSEIVSELPPIYPNQTDEIKWKHNTGMCTTAALYSLLQPTSLRVGWHHLLSGKFKIPRHGFVLWLAILERLSTMDRIWAYQANGSCALCGGLAVESHSHIFFECVFSQRCLMILKRRVRFCWLQRGWQTDIVWASRRWRGSHLLNMASRALLAAIVYHIWRERNSRRFLSTSSSAESVAARAIEEIRFRIMSEHIQPTLQSAVLHRVWKIPGDGR